MKRRILYAAGLAVLFAAGFSIGINLGHEHADDCPRCLLRKLRYPLLELDMDRKACERWLRSRGWTSVAKSACIGCPYHGNRMWRDMRDNRPDEWADAVAFDEAIRKGGARGTPLNGEAFLHRSRLPLSIAPIDRVTSAEWKSRQGDLLDVIADMAMDEEGDPDGCSPYGCRSGQAVTG